MFRQSTSFALAMSFCLTAQAQLPLGCGCGTPVPRPVVHRPVVPVAVAPRCVVPVMPQPVCTPIVQQTQLRPVVETVLRPQQITTYQAVTKTAVRQETVTVNVPVTTTREVTVDEGGYQMVWVPKMVTKQVQETKLQQQVQTRSVPYQIVEHVPQVQTRMVAENHVRYVPQTMTYMAGIPTLTGTTTLSAVPQAVPTVVAPNSTVVPNTALAPISETEGEQKWVKVPQKPAESEVQTQSFEEVVEAEPTPVAPTSATASAPPRRLFMPVPTAAAAWQSQLR